MSVSLGKGQQVNLNKEVPSLHQITVGLGWQMNMFDGADFDLDAEVFMLNAQGRVPSDEHFIFYHNRKSKEGAVEHLGDNRKGGTLSDSGKKLDDESIHVELDRLPDDIERLVFTVSIYEGEKRRQNFGMVSGAYIRIVDDATCKEICRYDLSEDASLETATIFAEIYRKNGEWRFTALGQGFKGGLKPLAIHYGVNVE